MYNRVTPIFRVTWGISGQRYFIMKINNTLLIFFSVLLTLCFLEIVYRIDHRRKIVEILGGRKPEQLITLPVDDGRIYALKANEQYTNSYGFYDTEWPNDTSDNTIRIAVIGDSVTMQGDTPRSESYVRQLETELNRRLKKHRVMMMNFAVTGYSMRQELVLLEKHVLPDFDVDVILWQYHYNDSIDPSVANADGGLATYYAHPYSYFWRFLQNKYYDHSKMLFKRKHNWNGLPSGLADQMYNYNEIDFIIDKITQLAHSNGVQLLVYVYPSWPWDNKWESFTERGFEAHDMLLKHFTSRGIPTLDLLPRFKKEDILKLRASPTDPWHPNSYGYKIITSALADWLPSSLE